MRSFWNASSSITLNLEAMYRQLSPIGLIFPERFLWRIDKTVFLHICMQLSTANPADIGRVCNASKLVAGTGVA
jgi:hypothetical protein